MTDRFKGYSEQNNQIDTERRGKEDQPLLCLLNVSMQNVWISNIHRHPGCFGRRARQLVLGNLRRRYLVVQLVVWIINKINKKIKNWTGSHDVPTGLCVFWFLFWLIIRPLKNWRIWNGQVELFPLKMNIVSRPTETSKFCETWKDLVILSVLAAGLRN